MLGGRSAATAKCPTVVTAKSSGTRMDLKLRSGVGSMTRVNGFSATRQSANRGRGVDPRPQFSDVHSLTLVATQTRVATSLSEWNGDIGLSGAAIRIGEYCAAHAEPLGKIAQAKLIGIRRKTGTSPMYCSDPD